MSDRSHERHDPPVPRVPPDSSHRLLQPETIRKLWIALAVVLALTVVAEFFLEPHPHFGFDGIPGFSAVFGLVAGVLWLTLSKLLGSLLKRPDTYYDD